MPLLTPLITSRWSGDAPGIRLCGDLQSLKEKSRIPVAGSLAVISCDRGALTVLTSRTVAHYQLLQLPTVRVAAVVPKFASKLSKLSQQLHTLAFPMVEIRASEMSPKFRWPLPWMDHEEAAGDCRKLVVLKSADLVEYPLDARLFFEFGNAKNWHSNLAKGQTLREDRLHCLSVC